jgi:hypothetical protein
VNGLFVFLVDVVAHLMTADAELQGIRGFHRGVEAAPEEDAGEKAHDQKA